MDYTQAWYSLCRNLIQFLPERYILFFAITIQQDYIALIPGVTHIPKHTHEWCDTDSAGDAYNVILWWMQ